jgi:hypothetical protein
MAGPGDVILTAAAIARQTGARMAKPNRLRQISKARFISTAIHPK